MGGQSLNMEGRRGHGIIADRSSVGELLCLGRSLLEALGTTMYTTGMGLGSVLLPVGFRRLLILGIPVPIFGYLGEGDMELHDEALAWLRGELSDGVPPEIRLEAQVFGPAAVNGYFTRVLDWLPRVREAAPQLRPPILGVALVTVFPLETSHARMWPLGPDWAVELAGQLERRVPDLYEFLNSALSRLLDGAVERSALPYDGVQL